MDNLWFMDLLPKIFSFVSYSMDEIPEIADMKIKYTDESFNVTEAVFPTVYIHELTGPELGNDLENTTVNAVNELIQIDVFNVTGEMDNRKILAAAIVAMKGLRFTMSDKPFVNTEGSLTTGIIRFRRIIAAGDTL